MTGETLLTILGMAVATYATRAGGFWLMGRLKPTPQLNRLAAKAPTGHPPVHRCTDGPLQRTSRGDGRCRDGSGRQSDPPSVAADQCRGYRCVGATICVIEGAPQPYRPPCCG